MKVGDQEGVFFGSSGPIGTIGGQNGPKGIHT